MLNVRDLFDKLSDTKKEFLRKTLTDISIRALAGRIPTTELVNRTFMFCELYSGKELFPYQEQFSKRVIRSVLENDGDEITALFSRQSGKCFAKGTEILMYDGTIKKVEDIKVGDTLISPDSRPVIVTSLGHGFEEMFEVKPRNKNQESFTVNKSHILSLVDRKGEVHNIEVKDYLDLPLWKRKDWYRGYRNSVEYDEIPLPIEPYFIGLWLGDGSSYDVKITTTDNEVIQYLSEYADRLGMSLHEYTYKNRCTDYAITRGNHGKRVPNEIKEFLLDNDLIGNKHIPLSCLINSRKIRLEILAGLIDSDGHKSDISGKENTLEICLSNKRLACDVLRLIRSLGFRASIKEKISKCKGKNFLTFRILAYGDFSVVPTKIPRKQWKKLNLKENPLTYGFDLIPKGVGEYYGFTIDSPDHLFLLADYTVVHNTETISVTSGGMMILFPLLANMPMFASDSRFQMFVNGVWIGIFAPNQRQAGITFNRIRNQLLSKTAIAVLESPEFNLIFTTSNGTNVSLSNGSHVMAISASEGSNIEGESCMVIICEECFVKGTPILTENGYVNIEDIKEFDKVYSFNHATNIVELKTVVRSFSQPLYGRRIVTIKTKSGKQIVCTDNHKIYVPNKGKYVRADSLQLGDLMLSHNHTTQESEMVYSETNDFRHNVGRRVSFLPRQKVFTKSKVCSNPVCETNRICLEQIRKSKAYLYSRTKNSKEFRKRKSALQIFYKVCYRFKAVSRYVLQRWKEINTKRNPRFDERRSPCLLVHGRWEFLRNDGYPHPMFFIKRKRNVSGVADKQVWDYSNNPKRCEDRQAVSVFQGAREKQVSEIDTSIHNSLYDVQNSFDGHRGSLCCVWKNDDTIPQQKSSDMFRRMQETIPKGVYEELPRTEEITEIVIEERDVVKVYDLTVEDNHNFFANSFLVHNCQDISNLKIQKSIMPMGAAYNATIIKIGTSTNFKGDFYDTIQRNKVHDLKANSYTRKHFEFDYTVASKYNPKYAKYIEKQKASLGEKSDAFRMAYKLEWIFERGMFVDILEFEANNCDNSLGIVDFDKENTYVVGIDLGGKRDSTVISLIQVNHDMPLVLESKMNEDGEEEWYETFNTYLVGWCEIKFMPDYEEQYPLILDYLSNFNIVRLVCDATRESAVAHRLRANLPYEVIPYVMTPKAKSDLYKNFEREIVTQRFSVASDSATRQTSQYKDFIGQLGELQKGWNGTNMVVSHPTERDAHDDFPDSCALALWGAMTRPISNTAETRKNVFMDRTKNQKVFSKRRNMLTARRR